MQVKDSDAPDFQIDQNSDWLSGQEARRELGFTNPQSVRNLRLAGDIEGRLKPNGHYEYCPQSIAAYLRRRQARRGGN
jgi:hypothetical protein